MTRRLQCLALLLAASAVMIGARRAQADDWGTLKGKFIYEGKAAPPTPLKIEKDPEVCGDKGLVNEDLVVDSKGGMANVMIYVKGTKVAVHPDYEKTAGDTIVLNNKGCRFEPHVQGIRVGQTLKLENSDPVSHNTNIVGRNLQFNPLIPPGAPVTQRIEQAEALPVMVSCNIHPWMKARLLVRANPYFAISKKDGTFEIKDLPYGDLEFIVYHERSGYVQDAELKGEKVKWPKGVVKVTIDAKEKDLGDIKLSEDQFNK